MECLRFEHSSLPYSPLVTCSNLQFMLISIENWLCFKWLAPHEYSGERECVCGGVGVGMGGGARVKMETGGFQNVLSSSLD